MHLRDFCKAVCVERAPELRRRSRSDLVDLLRDKMVAGDTWDERRVLLGALARRGPPTCGVGMSFGINGCTAAVCIRD